MLKNQYGKKYNSKQRAYVWGDGFVRTPVFLGFVYFRCPAHDCAASFSMTTMKNVIAMRKEVISLV